MFLPDAFSPDAQDKVAEEKTMKRQAIDRVEKLALDFVPQPYRQGRNNSMFMLFNRLVFYGNFIFRGFAYFSKKCHKRVME